MRHRTSTIVSLFCAFALGAMATVASAATHVDPDGLSLKAGQFAWLDEDAMHDDGPVTILVNLSAQRAYVYRDGRRIAVTTVSTGRRGNDTPVGVFPIMGKAVVHHSNRYNNAPMPYMQRLTNWGHALHAGDVRPYPASHGCVRLPREFAKQLFSLTNRGDLVVIAQEYTPRAIAIALKVAEMDHRTALAVGVTDPLPNIVWIGEETQQAGVGSGSAD